MEGMRSKVGGGSAHMPVTSTGARRFYSPRDKKTLDFFCRIKIIPILLQGRWVAKLEANGADVPLWCAAESEHQVRCTVVLVPRPISR